MSGKGLVYKLAVVTTAVGMFLPVLYGTIGHLRELLGSEPLLKSLAVVVIGWVVAYFTFEEGREELTAS